MVKEDWDNFEIPSLNNARANASSIVINQKVYVFCGNAYKSLKSIEVLGARVSEDGRVRWVSNEWHTFEPQELRPRRLPLVAPLSGNRLLVYGGQDENGNVLYDGIVINITRKNNYGYF